MQKLTLLLFASAILPLHADDQSDFSAPPGSSWLRFDPRAEAGLAAYGLPTAVFDFSGNQCHITAPQPMSLEEYNATGGRLTRAGLFAPTEFSDCVASVDIAAWTPSEDRNTNGIHMFVFTRVQEPIGINSITGFAAVVIDMGANSGPGGSRNGRLQIMRIQNEDAQITYYINDYIDFTFNPLHDYRLILASIGQTHTARIFDLTDLGLPVPQLIVTDSNYPTGRTGILIYNDRVAPLDVTFDNFLAWDGTPPPLTIQPGGEPGTIALSSDFHRSLATNLQSTTDFNDPLTPWLPDHPVSTTVNGDQLVSIFPIDGPRRFFRRKRL